MYDFNDTYAVYNATTENFMKQFVEYPDSNDGYRLVWREDEYHILRGDDLEVLDECFREGRGPISGPYHKIIEHFFHQRMYELIKTSLNAGEVVWLVKLIGNDDHILVPDFTNTEIMVR